MLAGIVLSHEAEGPPTPVHSDFLQAYERYRTRSPEAAEVASAAFLSPHRLSVGRDRDDFQAMGRFADAGGAAVGHMSYGSEVVIDRAGQDRYLAIGIPVIGHIEATHRGQQHVVSADGSMVLVGPGERLHMTWSPGCEVLTLRVDTEALKSALRTLAPHADDRSLRFTTPVIPFGVGIAVYGAARLLAGVFKRYRSSEEVPRRIIRQLADHTLITVLLSFEHNHSDEIMRYAKPSGPASVTAAVDLVTAETSAIHSVADLARHAGVSVRGLELGFRKALNVTPQAFLHQTRMAKARRDLVAADPGDGTTVTEVALRWGFGHTGRFAARYREIYGEMPSATLRGGGAPARA
ncbi:AraC family transcriptional regulator [Actinoallomurus sp. NBC_01490]|jgi:AraC-like DNA-binding protein|uniref:AraC family transcriptional regulator n=1 Tax=Actinoallomurus sp. NBC_01490 TaxID=2903557 RepID=UPI002E33BF96|nr:AraC family transcriptional regulator [Actinoallomurus sp. NBC_01490]